MIHWIFEFITSLLALVTSVIAALITLTSSSNITTAMAAGSTNLFGGGTGGSGPANGASEDTTVQGVSASDILTVANADLAINRLDQALTDIEVLRGDFGSVQNRFQATIANTMNVAENITAARSRIMDVDVAAEAAILTRNLIVQQAGVAILAQANQAPNVALALLQ